MLKNQSILGRYCRIAFAQGSAITILFCYFAAKRQLVVGVIFGEICVRMVFLAYVFLVE
ncbi:Transmembrane domain-containing protein [Spironucleus salmonicida]|nr:Transmembrane domain-containing protein [Spironucleus salmonicida]